MNTIKIKWPSEFEKDLKTKTGRLLFRTKCPECGAMMESDYDSIKIAKGIYCYICEKIIPAEISR